MELDHPFGFVAGRWAFATADTANDPDRGPDYVPASGASITFTPETPRHVVPDTPGWTGVINKRMVGKLNEDGRLVDAEGHNHFALGVGTYAVHYYFGNNIKWPSHRIQVTEAHTASNPLWLPPMPAPPDVPGDVNRTIQVPADGTDGQVLVWDGGAFSWDYPPTGPQGPPGDLDAEQLAGAPRLTNRVPDATQTIPGDATIDSQTDRQVAFTATARNGYVRWGNGMHTGNAYYVSAEVKTTSDQVLFGSTLDPVYHSGSGGWERITNRVDSTGNYFFQVRDQRSSGWDQVEVRDPVLINLTEVFGSGREPSKEYMDELLAKHDHYIGGVDQFAFGDALQALTIGAEQLAGAPRLTNIIHDTPWVAWSNSTIDSQTDRQVAFTATARNGLLRHHYTTGGRVHYYSAEVKTTSDQVYAGTGLFPAYHSGSGDWERLTGTIDTSSSVNFHVRDTRFSDWDEIEVRDPVLIDLTTAFGAGREPTVEYMDALLAKHGGYIGGVDQFAVGDALQALTVAGPGLALRYDNSVGTRVFLDHPGGSTMIHGDTGWRDVTDQARRIKEHTLGSRPGVAVRRIGNTVYWNARIKVAEDIVGTSSNFNLIQDVAVGFRETPTTYSNFQPTFRDGSTVYFTNGASSSLLTIHIQGTWGSEYYGVGASYVTDEAWPPTLPGLPV